MKRPVILIILLALIWIFTGCATNKNTRYEKCSHFTYQKTKAAHLNGGI